jgi:hypothetical protein
VKLSRYILIVFLFCAGLVLAQESNISSSTDNLEAKKDSTKKENFFMRKPAKAGEGTIAWKVSEDFGDETQCSPDTATLNFQEYNTPVYRNTIASEWLGNLGQPSQSAIFYQRKETDYTGDFLFKHTFYDQYIGASDAFFYNTKRPYSNISYMSGGLTDLEEDHLTAGLSMNATSKLNFGIFADYKYGRGSYSNQSTDDLNGYLNGSYRGKKYSIYFLAGLNNYKQFENGGLLNDSLIRTVDDTENIPVRLSNTWSEYNSFYFWVNQQYNIGEEKVDPNDSEKKDFVPLMTIGYTTKYEYSRKKYYERSMSSGFYDNNYYSNTASKDTCSQHFFKNVVSITFNEGYKKWMLFGLRAFVEADFEQNRMQVMDSIYVPLDGTNPLLGIGLDTLCRVHNQALVSVGGELFKRKGNTQYGVLGKVLVLGRDNRMAFDISGDFSTKIKLKDDLNLHISALGHLKSTNPSYFTEHYYSNHFIWENHFNNTWSARGYGEIAIPYKYCSIKLGAGWQGLKNYIYFDKNAMPTQDTEHFIQIINADLELNLSAWLLHWDNKVSFQYVNEPSIVPLPMISAYSNFYFRHSFLKDDILTVQIGVDCRYNTAYYANAYMPATGVFHLQDETLVGNYPLMNAYVNLHLKQFRVYLMCYNLSAAFMEPTYFTVPHYPLNPIMFKFGLSWNFYD